jgi:uncharacterized protein (DUF488 family)
VHTVSEGTRLNFGMHRLATIGYEGASVADFLQALRRAKIALLVDVRAVAMSRRPGFAKTALAANLREAGIDYLHLRALGTPADGRAAARSGKHDAMRRIFLAHLAEPDAQDALQTLGDLVRSDRRICILCFEADPAHCHRRLVATALQERMPLEVDDLFPGSEAE